MFRTALICVLGGGLTVPLAAADVERTIRAELSGPDASSFSVENLAGRMRVTAAGDRVEVVATIRAESAELADAVRIERVSDGPVPATLRVRLPYDRVSIVRYAEPGEERDWPFGDVGSTTEYKYDGRRVRVNPGRGTRLSVDLEIRVPASFQRADFKNLVGRIEADGLAGAMTFDVGSADLRLRRLDGEISIDGASGDVEASDIRGDWSFDSASGDLRLDRFDGRTFRFDAASGDLVARGVRADRFESDTSSGDVTVTVADIEEFAADTSSGDVAVEVTGGRLSSFRADTSSGDVSLSLPPNSSFDARADQSSGDMRVDFTGGTAVHDDDALVAYRLGTGGARILVTTSSGDFSISPR